LITEWGRAFCRTTSFRVVDMCVWLRRGRKERKGRDNGGWLRFSSFLLLLLWFRLGALRECTRTMADGRV
jgi:hypothetical protein